MAPICKLLRSRDQWKEKARDRAYQLRESRRRCARQEQRLAAQGDLIENLSLKNLRLMKEKEASEAENAQLRLSNAVGQGIPTERVPAICIRLLIDTSISFRAVPKILGFFHDQALQGFGWIPHFTSVILWCLRGGLALLQSVRHRSERWIGIVDCSINLGVSKVLVVLRVNLDALERNSGEALGLDDCECIGVRVATSWKGEKVSEALKEIFEKAGSPAAILKDQGTDLRKGVNLWRKSCPPGQRPWVIQDIGHIAGNALKAEFSRLKPFTNFLGILRKGASRLRQTDLASVLPPKVRTKGRFMGLGRVAQWAELMLALIQGQGRAPENSLRQRLRKAFRGLCGVRPFLIRFILAYRVTHELLHLLKVQGLNQETYHQAMQILEKLPESAKSRTVLKRWLNRHLSIQGRLSMGQTPLAVSSDVIESLLGKLKMLIQRSAQGEMNRMVLTLPLLCGTHTEQDLQRAMAKVRHRDLKTWEKNNLPLTLRQLRRKILDPVTLAAGFQKPGRPPVPA
jgi:hypothetical protein